MALIGHVICFILVLGLAKASSETEHSIHHNLNYPFVLNAEGHRFEGRVCSDMELFSLIPIEPDNLEEELRGGACVTYLEQYLRLVVRIVTWPEDVPRTTTARHHHENQTLNLQHPHVSSPIDLPSDVDFDVINTDLIDVDDAYYLIVGKPDTLRQQQEVQFYVVLINTTSLDIMSNPLPFAVRIDRPPEEGRPHGAALFAGVLVLVIILIALLIPVTVCVKRRRKAGKPICNCSDPAPAEDTVEIKGHTNSGFVEARPGRSDSNLSSINPQQTIGSHQLSSVSNMHFTPDWLDPHYKELEPRYKETERYTDSDIRKHGIEIKIEQATPRSSQVEAECRL